MVYKEAGLILGEDYLKDELGRVESHQLQETNHKKEINISKTTELVEKMIHVALHDVEANIIEVEDVKYFGAGKKFGAAVFTRDIALAGILALNQLYPELMLKSIKHTREIRKQKGFNVTKDYVMNDIKAPWKVIQPIEREDAVNKKLFEGGPITRRTDDVVWIWCTYDLIKDNEEELVWFYEIACYFFENYYRPFYDEEDGLYRGQACFIDIHFPQFKANGYPSHWSITDCAMIKSLSTNCLYKAAMDRMTLAAKALGRSEEEKMWARQSSNLKQAIIKELKLKDGTLAYYKDANGIVTERREALGTAFAVLHGIVEGEEAKELLLSYPKTNKGVPLFYPFFDLDTENYAIKPFNHNDSTWPFVDRFFIRALEKATHEDLSGYNIALLARTCRDDGTFHELVDAITGEIKGSKSQLWTAAAFLNICLEKSMIH
ncbi:MGH1-like glycoside hydrolase domain-containing protein [Vallitalea okinawensis]|uniref:MGH1-like glycoside hydrolase domain-containing protein n=1 Tax=Vallitalea okinawensis TaxID=2078660 RepID=UPI000CFD94FB|nr:hypothetical protein [Vallitalea okinawensis]